MAVWVAKSYLQKSLFLDFINFSESAMCLLFLLYTLGIVYT